MPGLLGAITLLVILAGRTYMNGGAGHAHSTVWLKRNAEFWKFGGLFILLCACALFIWGRSAVLREGAAPITVIAAADFVPVDLTGKLQEVLLDGYFQLEHIKTIEFKRDIGTFNFDSVLIPVTGADWRAGDPVSIYITPNWFGSGTTGADLAEGWRKEGFADGPVGAVHQTRLLAKARLFGFNGDVTQAVAAAGLPTAGPVQVLQIIDGDGRRDRLIDAAYQGRFELAKIAMGFGLVLLGASYFGRLFLAKGND